MLTKVLHWSHGGPAAVVFLLSWSVSTASAQDVQGFKPALGVTGYGSVEGAPIAGEWQYVPSLFVTYGRNPLVRKDADGKVVERVIENLTTVDAMVAVGLHPRFELGLDVPVGYNSGEATSVTVEDGAALGDVRLVPKVVGLGHDSPIGPGLALEVPVTFPTGNKEKGMSSDHVLLTPSLIADYRADKFSLAGNVGFRWRPSQNDDSQPLEVGNGVVWGAAGSVNVGTPKAAVLVEVFGTHYTAVDEADGGADPIEALLGGRYRSDLGLIFTLMGGIGLVSDFGAPEYRIVAGVAFARPAPVREPEPPKPVVEAPVDGDKDKDGVKDSSDKCPAVAEDADNFDDTDGCPDLDNDKDGVVDTSDKCPLAPEDQDGFEDADGCPDPDNDKDGIADTGDRCPLVPENMNGFRDDDGCPDADRVVVTAQNIQILDKVYFDTDRDTIKEQSFAILNQVAAVLKASPDIKKLRVEGHTDRWGNKDKNLDLSRRRAAAVVRHIVGQGVAAERLESEGYGSTRRIGDDNTEEGAAANRRVEFKILERSTPAAAAPPADAPARGGAAAASPAPSRDGEAASPEPRGRPLQYDPPAHYDDEP